MYMDILLSPRRYAISTSLISSYRLQFVLTYLSFQPATAKPSEFRDKA